MGVRVGRGRGPEAKEWGAEGRGRKGRVVGNEVMGGAQDGPYAVLSTNRWEHKLGMNEMGTAGGVGTGE